MSAFMGARQFVFAVAGGGRLILLLRRHLALDWQPTLRRQAHSLGGLAVFGGQPCDGEHAVSVYEANVRAVMETVPSVRMLVHNLRL
jgi:hypothetical protein